MTVQSPFSRVFIRAKAKRMLDTWVAMADKEISFLGLVEDTPLGPCVTELFLPKQKNTGVHTDMDDGAVMNLMTELAMEGKGREGQLRAWLHSHVNMACEWSTMDQDTMNKLKNPTYSVSIVVNKKGEFRCRVDLYEPYRIWFDELPLLTYIPQYDVKAECERLFKVNVTEEAYAYAPAACGGQGNYGSAGYGRGTQYGRDPLPPVSGKPTQVLRDGKYVDLPAGQAGSGKIEGRKDAADTRFPAEVRTIKIANEDDLEECVMLGKITIDEYARVMFPNLIGQTDIRFLGVQPKDDTSKGAATDAGAVEDAT